MLEYGRFSEAFDRGFDELALGGVASPFNVYPVDLEVEGGVGGKLSPHPVYKCLCRKRGRGVGNRSS